MYATRSLPILGKQNFMDSFNPLSYYELVKWRDMVEFRTGGHIQKSGMHVLPSYATVFILIAVWRGGFGVRRKYPRPALIQYISSHRKYDY